MLRHTVAQLNRSVRAALVLLSCLVVPHRCNQYICLPHALQELVISGVEQVPEFGQTKYKSSILDLALCHIPRRTFRLRPLRIILLALSGPATYGQICMQCLNGATTSLKVASLSNRNAWMVFETEQAVDGELHLQHADFKDCQISRKGALLQAPKEQGSIGTNTQYPLRTRVPHQDVPGGSACSCCLHQTCEVGVVVTTSEVKWKSPQPTLQPEASTRTKLRAPKTETSK